MISNNTFSIESERTGLIANFSLLLEENGNFIYDIAFLNDAGTRCVGHTRLVLDHCINNEEEAKSYLL